MKGRHFAFAVLLAVSSAAVGLVIGLNLQVRAAEEAPFALGDLVPGTVLAEEPRSRHSDQSLSDSRAPADAGESNVAPVSEKTEQVPVGEQRLILKAMSGADIESLSDSVLAEFELRVLQDEVIWRSSTTNRALGFLHSSMHGDSASFDHLLGRFARRYDLSPDALEEARKELVRLRIRVEQIWFDEQHAPGFTPYVASVVPLSVRKRFLASWYGYYQRIADRARPFMKNSESIILGIFMISDPAVTLFRWH